MCTAWHRDHEARKQTLTGSLQDVRASMCGGIHVPRQQGDDCSSVAGGLNPNQSRVHTTPQITTCLRYMFRCGLETSGLSL